jgi:L-lactate permease
MTPMRLRIVLLIAWVGGSLLGALAGYPVPAAITFVGYVAWTIARDIRASRART